MPLKKQKKKWPKLPGSLGAITYRLPIPIKEVVIYKSGNCYPRCPRCGQSMDREYMRFCDGCGQKLEWRGFTLGKVCEVVL